jgi:hypothetical protein
MKKSAPIGEKKIVEDLSANKNDEEDNKYLRPYFND